MIIGFTGSRRPLLTSQAVALSTAIRRITKPTQGHHGDCTGGDVEFHSWMMHHHPLVPIHIHPPENDKHRAHVLARKNLDVLYPEKPYLERNADIVEAADFLIACPSSMSYRPHSGTWATILMAEKLKRPRLIIFPNGVEEFYP